MEQYHFAARVYGPICVRQPLTPAQADKFVQLAGETEDIEIFFVMGGYFIVPHFEPGVIFVEDPKGYRGQLFVKLKGSRTFWSMLRTELSGCQESTETLLKYAGTLAKQIRSCEPIIAHAAYRKMALQLAAMMDIANPRFIDARQTDFIRMETEYGMDITAMAAGA